MAILALALAAYAGDEKGNVVQFNDLPAAVQQALTQQAGNATVQKIIKSPIMYEVDFTLDGAKQNILVSDDATKTEGPRPAASCKPAGTVVQWSDVTDAVKNLVATKLAGASVDEVRRRASTYAATLDDGGKISVVCVAEEGAVLSRHGVNEAADKKQLEEHRRKEMELQRENQQQAQ